jgi:hypothetical protein
MRKHHNCTHNNEKHRYWCINMNGAHQCAITNVEHRCVFGQKNTSAHGSWSTSAPLLEKEHQSVFLIWKRIDKKTFDRLPPLLTSTINIKVINLLGRFCKNPHYKGVFLVVKRGPYFVCRILAMMRHG